MFEKKVKSKNREGKRNYEFESKKTLKEERTEMPWKIKKRRKGKKEKRKKITK